MAAVLTSAPQTPPTGPAPPGPRLLDRLTDALRTRGYVASIRQAYVDWVRRYILYYGKRHPQELGAIQVGGFLEHLADQESATTFAVAEARGALVFVYEVVLAGAPFDPGGVTAISRWSSAATPPEQDDH